MRHAAYGAAIEQAQAASAAAPPAMLRAGYEQLLATAYSFINDLTAACQHSRAALAEYEALGAEDSASDAVLKLASDLNSYAREDAWQEADTLLMDWSERDYVGAIFLPPSASRNCTCRSVWRAFCHQPRNGVIQLCWMKRSIPCSALKHLPRNCPNARRSAGWAVCSKCEGRSARPG